MNDHVGMGSGESRGIVGLYEMATTLESEFRSLVLADSGATLTGAQTGAFNRLLAAARDILPHSVALRDDAAAIETDSGDPVDTAYRAVHVTLVPTLHNALGQSDYAAT